MSERWLSASDWRGYGTTVWPAFCWRSEEGGLRAMACEQPLDLVTREIYRDFVLTLEWWLPRTGHSGIRYRVDETFPEAVQTGPEMRLAGAEAPDAGNPLASCGALYDLLPPSDPPRASKERFRTAQLVVQELHVEHWIDGRLVLSYELDDDPLQRRIEKSRFAAFPRFGRCETGGIVLQHGGSEARFRNLQVKTL